MDAIKKRAALQGRPLINQSPANHTTMRSTCKRIVCILALWGLLTPKTATAILKALGLRDE